MQDSFDSEKTTATGAPVLPKEPATVVFPQRTDSSPEQNADMSPVSAEEKDSLVVADIIADEADSMLKQEDDAAELHAQPEHKSWRKRLVLPFVSWWRHKKLRYATLLALLLLVTTMFAVPVSRYAVLNTVGARGSASMQVFDAKTKQPLKNVQVRVHGVSALTDQNGQVSLHDIPLGKTKLEIQKLAFGAQTKDVVLGWGSNPLGSIELIATGAQYTFHLQDFLSKQGLERVEVSYQESSALSDATGNATLTIEPTDEATIAVTVSMPEYRTEVIDISTASKDLRTVDLVPMRPHVFISKRTGKLAVYKIDVDGKNESLLLEATGKEDAQRMDLKVSGDGSTVALVSTRDGDLNKDKYMLSGLFLIDVQSGKVTKIDSGEQLELIAWYGTKITYFKQVAGVSDANANRQKIISYDMLASRSQDLASANYIYRYVATDKEIIFAPANLYGDNAGASVTRVSPDGTAKIVMQGTSAWGLYRRSLEEVLIEAADSKYYVYTLGSNTKPVETTSGSSDRRDYLYTASADGKFALWLDNRDGKQALLLRDTITKQDTVVVAKSGIYSPIYWLDNTHVVYRVSSQSEEADYVVSVHGGDAVKVTDVQQTYNYKGYYY